MILKTMGIITRTDPQHFAQNFLGKVEKILSTKFHSRDIINIYTCEITKNDRCIILKVITLLIF